MLTESNPTSTPGRSDIPALTSFQKIGRALTSDRLAWVWLLVAFLLLPFTAWKHVLPLAAWLAPVFLLRFARTSRRPRLIIPLIVLAYTFTILIDWWGGPLDALALIVGVGIALGRGLLNALPYLADRHIGRRLGTWGRLLLFPLAFTGLDWAMGLLKPMTTHGSLAYSQYAVLPLAQLVSITGLWGLTFLIGWFASTVNACWEASFRGPAVRVKLALFAAVLAAVGIFGAVRLSLTHGQSATYVEVATITNETVYDTLDGMDLGAFYQASDAARAAIQPQFQAVDDILFTRLETALQAGAKIVVTQETGGLVLAEDQSQVLGRAEALASQYQAYLSLTLWVFDRTEALPYIHNQTFLIDPAGQLAWSYEKTYPVFGSENFIVYSGGGQLPVLDTPFGRMSAAICNDLNYPALLRQVSQNRVDILLAPFSDDPAISTQDPAEAAYRAIENGVATIRAAGMGTSMTIDPEGRTLASQDYFTTDSHVMLGRLPLRRVQTVYGSIGDLFAYLCLGGFVLLSIWAFVPYLMKRGKQLAQ